MNDKDNAGLDEHDRRRYLRVIDQVILMCSPANPDDLNRIESRIDQPMDAYDLSAQLELMNQESRILLRRVEKIEPILGEYLDLLERKIAALSGFLLDQESERLEQQPQTVSLSASGLGFYSECPRESGDVLELRLILLPERIGLHLYGRVITSELTSTREHPPYHLAVDFMGISDHDREILIAHLIRVERLQLRQEYQCST
ncbi:MAG: PilZ domain-containing protein [Methylococcaceae bacterium]